MNDEASYFHFSGMHALNAPASSTRLPLFRDTDAYDPNSPPQPFNTYLRQF